MDTVLVVAVPTQNATQEEREQLRRYVQLGGKIIAIGATSGALLPRAAVLADVPHYAWHTYPALLPSGITSNAPEIVMAPLVFWRRNDYTSQIQYGDSRAGVVAS